jgi:hypothetical protein
VNYVVIEARIKRYPKKDTYTMDPENNTGGAAPAASTPVTTASETPAIAVVAPSAPITSLPETTVTTVDPTGTSATLTPTETPKVEVPVQATSTAEPVKTEGTTILGGIPPKTESKITETAKSAEQNKPAEGVKPAEQPKAEGSPSAEPAPLPTYERFTLPEGIQIDEKKLGEFTKDLGEFQVANKVEQTKVQEFAQKLVNRYIAESKETVDRLVKSYEATWEKQKNDWKESFISDPELGGNRQETTATAVQNLVDEFGGSKEQITELRKFMDLGIGNNPNLIRLMKNAADTITDMRKKYETETNRPLTGQRPETVKKSKTQTLYGKTASS